MRNLILWIVVGITLFSVAQMFEAPVPGGERLSYTTFLQRLDEDMIETATIRDHKVVGQMRTSEGTLKHYEVVVPDDPTLYDRLVKHNVIVNVKEPEQMPFLVSVLISWFPMLLLIAVWVFFMRQMQSGGRTGPGGAFNFGKSRAKLLTENKNKVTFKDVAGCDEAKQEVQEIIEFLKDPAKFTRLGGRIPKGVLLVGPPGTGKTLLARAIAGEAGVPFFSISGSDFVEMFVGVGAARVRDMFEQARKHAPCIVFIDEIDAMGRHRGAGIGGGNDEREQTLNQLLVEMDGFDSTEGVILIAATNRPDVLDPALLRPGRFDRQVVVPRPDLKGREEILRVHARKVPLADDVDLKQIARGTPGFAGADLANLVNEAALIAARHDRDKVTKADFEAAKDKVLMGVERRSMLLTEEQKKTTAYHEAGHTIVAKHVPHADPVHKVTIIPRGQALGVTMQLPEEDRFNYDAAYLHDQIAIMMGGRIAEELVLGQKTTGAANDFERATQTARNMVTTWGMSERLGPLVYGEREHQPFLGLDLTRQSHLSQKTIEAIDAEVRRIVEHNYERARKILEEHMHELHNLAQALMKHETLEEEEIDLAMAGKDIPRPPEGGPGAGGGEGKAEGDARKAGPDVAPEPDASVS